MALNRGQGLSADNNAFSYPSMHGGAQRSSSPQHVQATDPATAYHSEPSEEQRRESLGTKASQSQNDGSLSFSGDLTNLPPPQKDVGSSASNLDQPPSKRPSGSHNMMPPLRNHKRQRIVAPSSQLVESITSDPNGGAIDGDPSQMQQQQLDATSYPAESFLYAPLMNQPAPILSPVHHQIALPSQNSMHQQSDMHDTTSGRQQATSSVTTSGASVPKTSTREAKSDDALNVATSQPTSASGVAPSKNNPRVKPEAEESTEQPGIQAQGQQRTRQHPKRRSNQRTVEGLTFGDDWRDPFMGFLESE